MVRKFVRAGVFEGGQQKFGAERGGVKKIAPKCAKISGCYKKYPKMRRQIKISAPKAPEREARNFYFRKYTPPTHVLSDHSLS